jgi:hypothetical protein
VAAVKEMGKSERGPRGSHPLSRLGLGRSEEGCPRRRAEVGKRSSGGSAAELGRRQAVAVVVVVVRGCARGLFIGEARRWSGRGAVEAGELGGAALMALGIAARGAAARFAAAQR